jgi:Family of unknown function (DUF6200)
MANQPAGSTTEHRETEKTSHAKLVVVDLGKPQSAKKIKRLRQGEGKLMGRIETIVSELVEAGTIKASSQPVVIVVREETRLPWMFS